MEPVAPAFVNMRSADFLYQLGLRRMRVVAPASDQAWSGRDASRAQRRSRAYRASDKRMVVVRDWTVTLAPRHPEDWDGHPWAFRTLDMLGYTASGPMSPVGISPYQVNVLFFAVGRETVNRILKGGVSVDYFLDHLDGHWKSPVGDASGTDV